jgi:cell filamentation protein, protein adenylyltransferase
VDVVSDRATPPAPRASARAGEFKLAESGPDGYWAFHPCPLPPDPPLRIDAHMQQLLDRANQALGRLDGITLLLPDPDQFIYTFVRKEAVLSSQIEGTQSSLSDLLLFEHDAAPGALREDARETANYIEAMNLGLQQIATPGAPPLSARLLRDVHRRLLQTGRGADKRPGEFRREQNWLGGRRPALARFVPPPSPEVAPAMSALERFIHDQPQATPVLIKAALAHAQFETIHPFLDGNGRVGRLLITLLLCSEDLLRRPLLYLSLYFKRNRDAYYDHLQRVRTDGDWEAWLQFFLEGVIEVAESTTITTQRIVTMVESDRRKIHSFGRGAATAHRVHDLATRSVVIGAGFAAETLGLSGPPVYAAIDRLEKAGILREATGRQRGKLYVYAEYLTILGEGTEPL